MMRDVAEYVRLRVLQLEVRRTAIELRLEQLAAQYSGLRLGTENDVCAGDRVASAGTHLIESLIYAEAAHQAVARLHHEIAAVGGPDAPGHAIEAAHHISEAAVCALRRQEIVSPPSKPIAS